MTDVPHPPEPPGPVESGPADAGGDPTHLAGALHALREQLHALERVVGPALETARAQEEEAASAAAKHLRPAWQRSTEGESRLTVAAVIIVAVVLQVVLPPHLTFGPPWLLPALEGALLAGLVVANPRRINRTSVALRGTSLLLIAVISLGNAWSSAALVKGLIRGTEGSSAGPLLASGASIYLTNIIVFGLWYWEWDRGGPVARANGERSYPDFLFPQMSQPELTSPEWEPSFVDYLYTSFTNATAFSPTDTMPLSQWAKMLMLLQASVALMTVALVVARAVNILH